MGILDKDGPLTREQAKANLLYEKSTGVFRWAVSKGNVTAGKIAGTNHSGYLTVSINKKQYFLHRLAWLIEYGKWPENFIDHINGDKKDNRLENLRDVCYSENNQNLHRAKSTNKSGFLGVAWHGKTRNWQASIRINGKCTHLGYFNCPQEAHRAYLDKRAEVRPISRPSINMG